MRVFLSWSGEASRLAATALHEWLPLVVQSVNPYMSAEDLEKGARWSNEIANELEACNFGIICLTPENIAAPWIHFEAGALSKSLDAGRVSPVLLGLKPTDVIGPLVQFQFTLPERDDVLRLVCAINGAGAGGLDRERLERVFDALWPELQRRLDDVTAAIEGGAHTSPQREIADMLEELLDLSRTQTRLLAQRDLHGRQVELDERDRLLELFQRRHRLAHEVLDLPPHTQTGASATTFSILVPGDPDTVDPAALERLRALPDFDGVDVIVKRRSPTRRRRRLPAGGGVESD